MLDRNSYCKECIYFKKEAEKEAWDFCIKNNKVTLPCLSCNKFVSIKECEKWVKN